MLRSYEPDAKLGTLMSRLAIFVPPFLEAYSGSLDR
jgi:hypothetical protein